MINELLTIDFIGFGSLTRNIEKENELMLSQIVAYYREKNGIEEKLTAIVILDIFNSKFKSIKTFVFKIHL